MKPILRYLCALLVGVQVANAQTKTDEIIALFSQKSSVEWAVPIPQQTPLLLQWQARNSSFAKNGLHTFVGYYQNQLAATLTFDTQGLTANLTVAGKEYQLTAVAGGNLQVKLLKTAQSCGVEAHNPSAHQRPAEGTIAAYKAITQPEYYNALYRTPDTYILTDGVFRYYRLALVIDYVYFSTTFNNDVNEVRKFWANTEAFVNELYTRDVGVHFTVIDDEALIFKDKDKPLFSNTRWSADDKVNNGTITFNKHYDTKKYDLAVLITSAYPYNGLASMYAAYENHNKANAIARPAPSTVAHEMGHMFAASHTFQEGGRNGDSEKTEVGRGQSIMSYGHNYPRDFFSLPSLRSIRKFIGNSMRYYIDKERTQIGGVEAPSTGSNIVYGVKTTSKPPVIDRGTIKKEYVIPQDTYFQFYIHATDPDNDELLYMAHPADRNFYTWGNAKFLTYKPSPDNDIRFQERYIKNGNEYATERFSNFSGTGEYIFWVGAVDQNPANPAHLPQYDVVETKVKILSGKPFVITDFVNTKKTTLPTPHEYKAGEQLTLHWQVDKAIFGEDSKVRILLSDDLGKTFKHTIAESVPNSGTYTLTLPNIHIGTTEGNYNRQVGAGVIKIEVIDGLAYALSTTTPYSYGGFTLKADETQPNILAFEGILPQDLTVSCNAVPPVPTLTVTGTCQPLISKFEEQQIAGACPNNYTILRHWTATNSCGKRITHSQTITVEDKVAPTFVGTLPQNISIKQGEVIPTQATLTATDNCSGAVAVTATKTETTTQITYQWLAADACGNQATHQQVITIIPTVTTPTVSTPTEVTTEVIVYNGVSTQNTLNYFNITPTDKGQPISLLIFDEMGLKVYENLHYGNPDYFRGYANVAGVVGNKPLAGTYFYIVTYYRNGVQEVKKGYLYIN